jgi:hypothetical protein
VRVAALYVDERGVYALRPDVDAWTKALDARRYSGPYPVICHPPCGPWGKLRHMYRGDEHALAPLAVEQVRRWGGILEHPAHSLLWEYCRLPLPGELPDRFGGSSIEVNQCDWGHPARKRTWLYLVGIDRALLSFPPQREPTHWISGGRGRAGKKTKTTPVPPGIKVCSAQQRRRTPIAFAEWLVALARTANQGGAKP